MIGRRSYGKPDKAAIAALETLHLRSLDVLAGFETMVDRAEPAFRATADALGAGQPIDVTARLRSMRRELSLLLFETQAAASTRD